MNHPTIPQTTRRGIITGAVAALFGGLRPTPRPRRVLSVRTFSARDWDAIMAQCAKTAKEIELSAKEEREWLLKFSEGLDNLIAKTKAARAETPVTDTETLPASSRSLAIEMGGDLS